MFDTGDVQGIERAIQLAIAPAFILSGIFALLNVLIARLVRVTDRERSIREGGAVAQPHEIPVLARRARCIHRAVWSCGVAAIMLCFLVVAAFAGVLLRLGHAGVLAMLLTLGMVALITALLYFLIEVQLSARYLPLAKADDD